MTPLAFAAAFSVGLLIAVALFFVVVTYNSVVALRLRIDKAWANIEVVLKQRYDQLPNLVAAVRDVMAFEREVLERVSELRAAYAPADPIPRQAETSEATSAAVRELIAVVEQYPELRSADNVRDLQAGIERLEAMIADRRELYNDQVYRHNARIAQIPAVVLAPLFGWRARPFFSAGSEAGARPPVELGVRS
jgi:LemA protein